MERSNSPVVDPSTSSIYLMNINIDILIALMFCSPEDKCWPETYIEADFSRAVAVLIQNYKDSHKYGSVRMYERNFSNQEMMDGTAKVCTFPSPPKRSRD